MTSKSAMPRRRKPAHGPESDYLDAKSPRKRRRPSPEESESEESESQSEADSESGSEPITEDKSESESEDEAENGHETSDESEAERHNEKPVDLIKLPGIAVPSRVKNPSSLKDVKAKPTSKPAQGPTPTETQLLLPGLKTTTENTTFAALGVRPWLVQSLANMAIKRPTSIQRGCIPEILAGRDCIGGSRTGSGKTAAFAVPILQTWAADPSAIFALVLTPTRELALQIYEQFRAIGAPQSLRVALVTGGADMTAQAVQLSQRPHVVISTPGRLADHVRCSGEDTVCGFRRARFLVLDEADRLLDATGPGSMLPDVEQCLSVLPPPTQRQTLLFTATMTPEVLALKSMPPKPGKQAAFVCEVDPEMTGAVPATLKQMHLQVPVTHKEHYLHVFLSTKGNETKPTIIFVNRTATADYLHHLLRLLGHRATSLHSRLPQRLRTDNLARFRASAARILVATDVASRGLDIPEVALVVNYDVPRDPADYIHRVGRTARAGRRGEAVTLVGQRDVDLVLAIESRVGREMEAWAEEGVNLETRVVREALKVVSERKREALLEIEEGREVGGARRNKKVKLRVES